MNAITELVPTPSEWVNPQESLTPQVSVSPSDFNSIYRAEYPRMVRLARGLVDSSDIAEEIVQEAFAKLLDRWQRISNPGGYLRTAVVNGCRNEQRKRRVQRNLGLKVAQSNISSEQDYLLDALNQLSTIQKTVLVLKFYADMTEKQIAEVMGVRLGTVKSATSRGLANLRKVIKP
ncbi:MAG: SigE family RNA polymerase sigma factor [bacterium]|nr:SigE family RNA polymerase sigma factor [bacterium]MCY4257555.1 SigE family RNA polymerase sigma factor [bacterium]